MAKQYIRLDASLPTWVFDGGRDAAYKRLRIRQRVKKIAEAGKVGGN